MFRRIDAGGGETLGFTFEGREVRARKGDTIAAALLADGERMFRHTPVSGAGRGAFCMMGACYDCLVEIDGTPHRQACLTRVAQGMRVRRGRGNRPDGDGTAG